MNGYLTSDPGLNGRLSKEETLSAELSVIPTIKGVIRAYDKPDIYEGVYDITPQINELSLDTKGKLLIDDIKVSSIPYHEVQNSSGGVTVVIGGE